MGYFDESKSKPLTEVINYVMTLCSLQTQGYDVAIPYLAGRPGAGKTAIIYDACKSIKPEWGLINVHFALKPIEETGGIPNPEKIVIDGQEVSGTNWSIPDLICKVNQLAANHYNKPGQAVILNLDDSHLLTHVHMAVLYELLTERSMRGFTVRPNVAFTMMGNHGSNKAGARSMFSAIMNRIALLPIVAEYEGWRRQFANPNGVHKAIVSFLGHDRYGSKFFHEDEQTDTPWASPRSWTRLSTLMLANETWTGKRVPADLLVYLGAGHVGESAISEFVQYYEIYSKFDIADVLKQGENYKLPKDLIDRYALCFALWSYVEADPDKRIKPASKIIFKYLKEQEDLGLMLIHQILETENVSGRRNLFTSIAIELNKIEPGITGNLLSQATDAISDK